MPDVVELADGSIYRGTIAEYVAGSHVIITTPAGIRRVEAAMIVYAGPADSRPAPVPIRETSTASTAPPPGATQQNPLPAVRAPEEEVPLTFRSSGHPSLHVWSFTPLDPVRGARPFPARSRLCTAPCEVRIPKGTYEFALRGDRPHVQPVSRSIHIVERTTLEGEYDDNRSKRTAGWMTLGIGAGTGVLLFVVGAANADTPLMAAGGVITLASVPIGLGLGLSFDGATLRVSPPLPATMPRAQQ